MNIIFHVGLHKTGTTWLQNEVFSKIKDAHYLHTFEIDTILPNDEKPIIVSCEWLSGKPHMFESSEKMYIIAKRLKKCFPDAKIIVGFRQKDSWLKSLWKQHIMEGGTVGYSNFLQKVDEGFLDFDRYENFLRGLFDKVFVYHFEDLKKDKKGLVKEICRFIGVKEPNWQDLIYRESLSDRKINTLRLMNRIIPTAIKKRIFTIIVKNVAGSWRGKR